MSADRSWRVERAGVELAVRAVGDPGAPVALVAHGVGSSARFVVEAFGPAVTGAGHRLVTYDLRGHGRSSPVRDPAAHRLEEQTADLAAVAAEVEPVVVGGVSLGGHVAASWAVGRTDIRGAIVVIPAWIGRAAPGQGPHAAIAEQVRREGVARVLRRVVADPAVPRWLARLLERDWSACDPDSLGAALAALDGGEAPGVHELRRVTVPVGVVGWPDDPGHPLAVARRWASTVPRGALREVGMDEVGADPTRLGRVALGALAEAG